MAEIIIGILLALLTGLIYTNSRKESRSKKQDEEINKTKEKFIKSSNELDDLIKQYKRSRAQRDAINKRRSNRDGKDS